MEDLVSGKSLEVPFHDQIVEFQMTVRKQYDKTLKTSAILLEYRKIAACFVIRAIFLGVAQCTAVSRTASFGSIGLIHCFWVLSVTHTRTFPVHVPTTHV